MDYSGSGDLKRGGLTRQALARRMKSMSYRLRDDPLVHER
jgi:hypothetical protein